MFNITSKIKVMIKSDLIFDIIVNDKDNGDTYCYGFGIVPGEVISIKYDSHSNIEHEMCLSINTALSSIDMSLNSGFCEFTIVDANIGFISNSNCNAIYA